MCSKEARSDAELVLLSRACERLIPTLDNLTHTLTGLALARAGLGRNTPRAGLTLALACNLPDIDIVTGLWGRVAYLEHHRGITHAFAASPFLAAALAWAMSYFIREASRVRLFVLAWLGIVIHIASDLWTTYGTRVFLPFDATWYAGDWIFIIDPTLLAILALAVLASRFSKSPGAAQFFVLVALAFVAARAFVHSNALAAAQRIAGPAYADVRALPSPVSWRQWRVVAQNESTFAEGAVALGGATLPLRVERKLPETELTRRIAATDRAARVFLSFSSYPRLEIRRDGDFTNITWRDLRFSDRRVRGFLCEVVVDESQRIVSSDVLF